VAIASPFGPEFTRVASQGLGSLSPILGPDGNPYRAPVDPLAERNGTYAAQVFKDLIPKPALELDWDPCRVRQALNEHAIGLFSSSSALIDQISGLARVQEGLNSRTGALFGLDEIYESAQSDGTNEVRDAWKLAWPTCRAPIGQGDTQQEMRNAALMAGFSVAEIVWDTEVEPWQPYLKPWPLELLYRDPIKRQLRAITEDGPVDVTPGDGRWFVHAPMGLYRGHLNGLVRPLALPWLLFMLCARDWARFNERHGQPILLAKTPAMADDDDKKRYEDQLVNMGSEAVVTLPQGIDGQGFDLDLLEATANSWQGFDRLLLRCESTITIAIQWQNLTTEVKEGSEAAARVHGDVKQTAIEYDDRVWADDVQQQIARPFALWNFGDASKAPRTRRDVEALDDKLANCQALETFSRALVSLSQTNQPVDIAALARAYRVKLPLGTARTTEPTIYGYHLQAGIVKRDEMRARLGLPPLGGTQGDELIGNVAQALTAGDVKVDNG
jgi:phage gp29-like protein